MLGHAYVSTPPARAVTGALQQWPVFATVNYDRLEALAPRLSATYRSAQPFPHVVFDEFFDADVIDRIIDEFPGKEKQGWVEYDTGTEYKATSRGAQGLTPFVRQVLTELNSANTMVWLEAVTGTPGLIPDPYFYGGGLHETKPGGWLDAHIDFPQHPILPISRALNLIVYLNKDWKREWGGSLELFDKDGTSIVGIEPVYNRAVIFSTPDALHGHPHPLTCPKGMTRKSLAMFYWTGGITAGKPVVEFKKTSEHGRRTVQRVLKQLVPPIVYTGAAMLKRRGKA